MLFVIFMLFLNENNIFFTSRLQREVNDLRKEEARIRKEIANDSIQMLDMAMDIDKVESYGREVYYMKKENEDIFVIKH